MIKTLKDLEPGASGKVVMVKGKGGIKRRFMDMGVIKGTKINVEKVAPLGDPIEVKIKGYSLTLRKEDAQNIVIE
ncbi:FeoA family protein [Tepidibacter mesophilus]|uniref:FeoA family protein n=1 Tax=Tepidibacter mesophilus TaxID=655607 RepID=UPI002E8DD62D|nr:ferrous iron transport protein A [Tepidibacter mesophilus]